MKLRDVDAEGAEKLVVLDAYVSTARTLKVKKQRVAEMEDSHYSTPQDDTSTIMQKEGRKKLLRSFYLLSTLYVAHVILNTRPSRFSACNIEKLGVARGRGYVCCTASGRAILASSPGATQLFNVYRTIDAEKRESLVREIT